jgi:uncharacterized membrane protein
MMNKKEFILKLKESLIGMDQSEKREVLLDYEEHFFDGKNEGRTEEEICESLGDPKELAKNLMDASKKTTTTASNNEGVNAAGYIIGIVALSLGCLWLLGIVMSAIFTPLGMTFGIFAVLALPLHAMLKLTIIGALVFMIAVSVICVLLFIKLGVLICRWYKHLINGLNNSDNPPIKREFKMFKPKAWVWILLSVVAVIGFLVMFAGGINFGINTLDDVAKNGELYENDFALLEEIVEDLDIYIDDADFEDLEDLEKLERLEDMDRLKDLKKLRISKRVFSGPSCFGGHWVD